MKKLVSVLVIVLMLIPILASCNKSPEEAPSDYIEATENSTEADGVDDNEEEKEVIVNKIAPKSFKYDGSTLVLEADISSSAQGELTLLAEATSQSSTTSDTQKITLTDGKGTQKLTLADADGSAVKVKLTLSDGIGNILTTANLIFRNKLPQFSYDSVPLVVSCMTVEEKAAFLVGNYTTQNGYTGATTAIPRLGVPQINLNDGPAGVRKGTKATWLPSATVLASSWDTELVERIGYIAGEECLLEGVDILLTPGMNIQRSVLNGRNFEYYSEDPMLSGFMGAAFVNGLQATGVGASVKHYAVNNHETGRTTTSSELTERALREIYLRGFGYAVMNSEPYTVMSSYNKVNGTYTSVNKDLLSILRDEFGFEGFVMSDWGANGSSPDMVNAGNDIAMPGTADRYSSMLSALKNGTVGERIADIAITNMMNVILKTPSFSGGNVAPTDYSKHRAIVQEGAEGGIVLLKNDTALPISGEVALFGDGSYKTLYGGGGSGFMYSEGCISIASGIEAHSNLSLSSALKSLYSNGYANPTNAEINAAAKAAKVAVLTIQRNTTEASDHSSGKGDWLLSDKEYDLLSRVSSAFHAEGKKLIVLLNCGNPIETDSWNDLVDGLVFVGYAGQNTGAAVANILSGDVNPSGKVAATWPKTYESTPAEEYFGMATSTHYYEDIYVGYRYYSTFDVDVSYPFGYGLSYTTFEYSDLKCSASSISSAKDAITLSVTVKNTGSVGGREVVQFYVSKPDGVNEQARYDLCGFAKTELLAPNESQTISVTVSAEELKTYIENGAKWVIEKGEYTFSAGASIEDIKHTCKMSVSSDITVQAVTNKCVNKSNFEFLTKDNYSVEEKNRQDLLAYATATASDNEGGKYPAENAIDDSLATRWSAYDSKKGERILTIDLGDAYDIGRISTAWESNDAKKYIVYTSANGSTWTKVTDYSMPRGECGRFEHFYEDLSARYIRITVPSSSICCSIYDVVVEGPIGVTQKLTEVERKKNVALEATATANYQEGAYAPMCICDGVDSTRWSGYGYNGPTWVKLDLGAEYTLGRSLIYWETLSVKKFSVYTSSDGVNYKLASTYTIPSDVAHEKYISVFDFNGVSARYIKLDIPSSTYVSAYEWEIWER